MTDEAWQRAVRKHLDSIWARQKAYEEDLMDQSFQIQCGIDHPNPRLGSVFYQGATSPYCFGLVCHLDDIDHLHQGTP